MTSTATTPLPHASNDDYTGSVIAFSSVILVLSTLAIAARGLARFNTKDVRVALDDGFAVLGWVNKSIHVKMLYILIFG
jgi:hypothetical protein